MSRSGKMKKAYGVMAIALAVLACARADEGDGFNGDLFSGWRLTAGGAMNGNLRTKVGVRPDGAWRRTASAYGGYGSAGAGSSRAGAQAAGDAYRLGGGRLNFPNGGFIDPSDAAGIPGETWNWHMPAGSLDAGGTYSIVNSYFKSSTSESFGRVSSKDDDCAAGFSVGLDRLVWRWGDFGVDFGFLFGYFRKDDFFKADGRAYARTDRVASGDYVTDVSFNPAIVGDPWAQNPDGSYGAGTFDGPGPVLDLGAGDVTIGHRWANESATSRTRSYSVHARGDYEEIEMIFALKPWYDVTEWFRVQGTLGAAVSRTHVKFDVYGHGDGGAYAGRQRFDDWAAYGVGGLGGMFRYRGACLGFDFLARFLDDEIKIRGRDVRGAFDRGSWTFRVYAGYEF